MKLYNKYYILRHGEALSNVKNVVSCWPEKFKNPLTRHGKEMIMAVAEILKEKDINAIFASPLLRTKQTAQMVAKELNSELELEFDKSSTTFKKVKVVLDKRLREIGFGKLNGRPIKELDGALKKEADRIKKAVSRGETYQQVLKRTYEFLKDIDKKYQGKNILIVSHEGPLWMLEAKLRGMSLLEGLKAIPRDQRIHKGQIKELN